MSGVQIYTEAVKVIKEAILQSQYRAASIANKEQLSLYYGIGRYVSENSRKGFGGKEQLKPSVNNYRKNYRDFVDFLQRISNLCVNSMRLGVMI